MKQLAMIPALLLLAAQMPAASTQTWEMNIYADFLKGQFEGVSLTRDGQLRLAPDLETVFSADQPAIWSVVRAADGTLYLGTGHRGRVYRVSPSGDTTVLWEADEPEIFALALDAAGVLFAATSPDGKIYRINNGTAEEYFNPAATYIWSLAFGQDGSLYVGTGAEGKLFRVTARSNGDVYYETGQGHVTAMAVDSEGRLLAGTEPNGILYRIAEKGKAFVLYDANLPEIRALVPKPDGTVYAAALGGSVARRAAAATAAVKATAGGAIASTSITVSAAQGGVQIQPESAQSASKAVTTGSLPALPMMEISGVEKSALFKIHADHTVEKIWTSTEENAYDLVETGDKIVFSTDEKGRLYELENGGNVTLLVQTNEGEAVRLLDGEQGLLVATGNMGKLFRVKEGPGAKGSYQAPVHDAAKVARWGKLSWRADGAPGGAVTFQVRAGNSARPDATWSEWSEPLNNASGSQIPSPNARYVQWRATFEGGAGATPALDSVTLAYLPQNSAPTVSGITVTSFASPASPSASKSSVSTTNANAAYSITVTDTGEAGASTVSGTSTQNLSKSANDQVNIAWQAEDLDGDKLIHRIYFRGAGEREWKLMKDAIEESTYALDSDSLADGKYYFRIVSSDRPANPAEDAREGERVSSPVLVDHTPPEVTAAEPTRTGGNVELIVEAQDAASALRRAEYSLDAGPWTPISPADGIVDSLLERFVIRLQGIAAGEHLLVVRVHDSAENAGLVKVLLR